MRFDSAEFLLFFVLVLVLHRTVLHSRSFLVVASYLFYASWNPPFLLLLVASTALDFAVGRALERADSTGRRRVLLATSLLGNLGVLAWFKYSAFALDGLVAVGAVSEALAAPFYVQSAIPLGISFYTFQTISYTVDVYRGRISACRRPLDFALFVAFFPQLIAGPIVRADELLPQIRTHARSSADQTLDGVELCAVGLFKKVVLADNFALLVDACFADPGRYSGLSLLAGTFAFSAQIFCDFSGYTTMGRGLAKLLGFELPENFGYPLLASDPIEYRRQWHMTLGRWFRDYVYHPLGGDRAGAARTILNTMITWSLFGLWHGASLTFLAWGAMNGALISAHRLLRRSGPRVEGASAGVLNAASWLGMPLFIAFANVLFRASDLESAGIVLARIGTLATGEGVHLLWWLALGAVLALHVSSRRSYREDTLRRSSWPRRVALIAGMLAVLYLGAGSGAPFYYFQF